MFINYIKQFAIERDRYDRELELYKREQKAKIDAEVLEYQAESNSKLHDLAMRSAKQTGEYEHTFHQTRETLGIELAKLEAKKESMTENINDKIESLKDIIKAKDAEIQRLMTLIQSEIARKLPDVTIQNHR